MSKSVVSRRHFVGGALAVGAGALMVACGSAPPPTAAPVKPAESAPATAPAPANPPTAAPAAAPAKPGTATATITYMNSMGGPNGKLMDELIGKFEGDTGNKIEQQRMGADDMYAKLHITVPAGEAQDLALILTPGIPALARDQIIEEIDDKVAADRGYKAEDYAESPWKGGLYQGKRYHIPLDTVSILMFLNNKVFKDAGVIGADGGPTVPKTREDLMKMAKQLTKGDVFGLGLFTSYYGSFEGHLWANGANVFTPDFKKSALTDPAAIEAGEFWGSAFAKEKVSPALGVDELKAFIAGKLGIWIAGSFNAPGLNDAKVEFTTALVPKIYKTSKVWSLDHLFAFPRQTKKDDKKREASWAHVRWMTDHADAWTLQGGVMGSTKKVQNDPRVQKDPFLKVFAAEAPDWTVAQPTPKWGEAESKLVAAAQAIYSGQKPAKDALEQLAKEVDQIAAAP